LKKALKEKTGENTDLKNKVSFMNRENGELNKKLKLSKSLIEKKPKVDEGEIQ